MSYDPIIARELFDQDGPERPEEPKFYRDIERVARKSHICAGCDTTADGQQGTISKGEKYREIVVIDEDGFHLDRFCVGNCRFCVRRLSQEQKDAIQASVDREQAELEAIPY